MNDWTDIHLDFAREWHGKTYQQRWEEQGLTYQDAQEWIPVGFEPGGYWKVEEWKSQSFNPPQVAEWIKFGLGLEDCEFSTYLRWKGCQPNQTLDLKQLRKEFIAWRKDNQEDLDDEKVTKYNLKDFKIWLETSETNRAGVEENWEYFLDWYEERPNIWKATVERGMLSAGHKGDEFMKWDNGDKIIEILYQTIFIWKAEVDSNKKGSIISHDNSRQYQDYIPIVKRTEEEAKLSKENSQLKSDIRQERSKNQESQEKITKLEQEKMDLKLKCRKQEEQLAKMDTLQQQLRLTQDRIKELEHKLGIAIQTSEKSTQTNFGWDEELKQKDLKIEEFRQKLSAKQNKLSIKITPQLINPSPKDSSWVDLSTEAEDKPLSPSQIRARERQKKHEQSAQIQQANLLPKTPKQE